MAGLSLLVMAAGVGSRFGGIKQLEPVGPSGEVILDYSIFDALSAGFDRVVFVVRREIEEDFRALLGRHVEAVVDTRYVLQELDRLPPGHGVPPGRTKPWGTGHAILCCRDVIDGAFVAINADDFYGAGAYEGLARTLRRASSQGDVQEYCMAGYMLRQTLSEHGHVSRGVCSVAEGYLTAVRELTRVERREGVIAFTEDGQRWQPIAEDTVVSMNMWGFKPELFDELAAKFETFLERRETEPKSEFYIPAVVMELVTAGLARVEVVPTDARWVGVTYRDDLPSVRTAITELVDAGVYPVDVRAALSEGVLRRGGELRGL